MYEITCQECGSPEGDGVEVLKEEQKGRNTSKDSMISQDLHTTFHCERCEITEVVATGVLPETYTDHFESRQNCGKARLTVRVDDVEFEFEGIDEQISENTYYTSDGVRGTSKTHHVHIYANNPPTIPKGKHIVNIGEYLTAEMILGDVRYRENGARCLKFFKSLDSDVMEPIDTDTERPKSLNANSR